jgi:predicted metal-dependent HD superfamily phosphohydrolase
MDSNTKVTKNNFEGANFLLVSWLDTVANFSLPKDKDVEIFTLLGIQYKENTRYYHNWEHIKAMIKGLYSYPNEINDTLSIELAIWFHDVIYVPLRKDNESRSAKFFYEQLSLYLPIERVRKIMNYIEATKSHSKTTDNDLQVLLDLDLAILGQPKNSYQNYSNQIREEFGYVPNFLYKRGRKLVLKSFLDKPTIYQTSFFKEELEEQARENIREELESL